LYFCLFGCKFEIWRKKTHLILFQVGFFFIIISFIFSYFLLFIWFLLFCNFSSFKMILLYFPFLVSCFNFFHSYFVYLHFYFILMHFLKFYLVSIFFFKKNLVFLICFIMKIVLKKLFYFCLIRFRFEVWKKKTNFFFFKYGFCSLSFVLCFVSYFLSSIF